MRTHERGLDLSRRYYCEVVSDLVADVAHAASLIGEGSEVLGFDTQRSTDHAWGLRLQVFVAAERVDEIRTRLDGALPETFAGWPVRYYRWQAAAIAHHVEVSSLRDWLIDWLKFDPRDGMTTARWLATPQQLLLEVTAGEVFHDGIGELTEVRDQLRWFPDEVWLWLMSCEWSRVSAYEPLVGRTAEVGDELGSQLAAASLSGHVARLRLLQAQRYSPYAKWLGSTLAEVDGNLAALLAELAHARDYPARETALGAALVHVAATHNALGVTDPVQATLGDYDVRIAGAHRPYRVLNSSRFAEALDAQLPGSTLHKLGRVGAVDQLARPTDEMIHFSDWSARLEAIYADKLAS